MAKKDKGFSLDKGSAEDNKNTSFNISKDNSSKDSTSFELDKSSSDDTNATSGFNITKENSTKDSTKFELGYPGNSLNLIKHIKKRKIV